MSEEAVRQVLGHLCAPRPPEAPLERLGEGVQPGVLAGALLALGGAGLMAAGSAGGHRGRLRRELGGAASVGGLLLVSRASAAGLPEGDRCAQVETESSSLEAQHSS